MQTDDASAGTGPGTSGGTGSDWSSSAEDRIGMSKSYTH